MIHAIEFLASSYTRDESGIETGLNWIFAPVKSWYVAHPPGSTGGGPFFIQVWESHYLDLRVVFGNLAILATLCLVLPSLLRRKAKWIRIVSLSLGGLHGWYLAQGHGMVTGYRTSTLIGILTVLVTLTMVWLGWNASSQPATI